MNKKTKVRTMTLALDDCRCNKSWIESSLEFKEFLDTGNKKAVIRIRHPSHVAYIRQQLDEIEAYWTAQLEAIKAKP